jgi:hypothetical protein
LTKWVFVIFDKVAFDVLTPSLLFVKNIEVFVSKELLQERRQHSVKPSVEPSSSAAS